MPAFIPNIQHQKISNSKDKYPRVEEAQWKKFHINKYVIKLIFLCFKYYVIVI